jgi:putative nucleotidyltransferase with HDIG domain
VPPLDRILENLKSLEPLPQVALRVLALSDDPDASPNDLAGVIKTDPGITAKVLKLANSSYYGFQRKIESLEQAGNLLGTQRLFNLVLTSCAGRYFRTLGGCDEATAQRLWERSVLNAVTASLLARLHGGVDRNRAYTAGLLQDIGALVIARFAPECGAELGAARARGEDPIAVEQRVLGIQHAEIGARLAERWGFPEVLIDTLRHHHSPESAETDPLLASFCHLAESITSALDLEGGLDLAELNLDHEALALAGLDRDGLAEVGAELLAEMRKARAFVEV